MYLCTHARYVCRYKVAGQSHRACLRWGMSNRPSSSIFLHSTTSSLIAASCDQAIGPTRPRRRMSCGGAHWPEPMRCSGRFDWQSDWSNTITLELDPHSGIPWIPPAATSYRDSQTSAQPEPRQRPAMTPLPWQACRPLGPLRRRQSVSTWAQACLGLLS